MAPTGGTYGVGTIYKIHPRRRDVGFSGDSHFYWRRGRHPEVRLEECFCTMAGSTVQLLLAGLRKRSYFRAHTAQQLENGISGRSIPSTGNRTEVSLTARCFALLRVKFYGTTYYGGRNGIGAVYELSPRPTGEWRERVIYSFQSGNDGNSPISNLVSRRGRQSLWNDE